MFRDDEFPKHLHV